MNTIALIQTLSVTALISLLPTASQAKQNSEMNNLDSNGHSINEVTPAHFLIPETGQIGCYDNTEMIECPQVGERFFGQDYQANSYVGNGDGTVSDSITGLMWQQVPDDKGLNYQEAVTSCESLELGKYDDWRVPTTKVLFSISDFTLGWPYLDTSVFSLARQDVSKDEQYWTEYYVGTTIEGGENAAWGVNHGAGHIKAYPAEASGPMGSYVRCVRGSSSYGVNDFHDNRDGTITDRASGLMWQKADSVVGMDWEKALAYAEASTIAGYEDWRLPNVKELQSIVDYSRSPSATDKAAIGPAIDTTFFFITELDAGTTEYTQDYGYFWSSTSAYFNPLVSGYYYAWYVAFGTAVNGEGSDFHGAGAVRFDTKIENGPLAEGGERYYNFVRLVRNID